MIDIDGGFGQWADVGPRYVDDVGDTAHRDHPGFANAGRYTDDTGRNDIVEARVARDAENLYFYVETASPISPESDRWMTLFVNADRDAETGWHGYDWVVNRTRGGDGRPVLEGTRTGWNWKPVGVTVRRRVEGNRLMLAIPRAAVGLPETGEPWALEFKWADNFHQDDRIDAFTLYGDAAPPGRFNYLYRSEPVIGP